MSGHRLQRKIGGSESLGLQHVWLRKQGSEDRVAAKDPCPSLHNEQAVRFQPVALHGVGSLKVLKLDVILWLCAKVWMEA